MFSRSLSFKNTQPQVLYLLHAHTICTLSSYRPHTVGTDVAVLEFKRMGSKGWWPVSRTTATLSFYILIAWSSFVLPERFTH